MKRARRRVNVDLDELDRVLDGARQAPLSQADCEKIKEALHALAAMLEQPRNTERPVPYCRNQKMREAMARVKQRRTQHRRGTAAMGRMRLLERGRSPWRTTT